MAADRASLYNAPPVTAKPFAHGIRENIAQATQKQPRADRLGFINSGAGIFAV